MTPDTFFEKFDLFADAPDAVGKMRELVLEMAVRGRLVDQDRNDEPVAQLLSENDQQRKLVAKVDHRADEEPQSLLSADDRWDVPETWEWRGLADLVLFVDYRGKTPAKLDKGIRLLTAKNVRKGFINLSPEEFLSEREYHQWMTRGIPKTGDVLFTTEAPMGNAAVITVEDCFALAQRVICFQSYGAIEPAFLVLQILSARFQCILDTNGTGVTAKGIKASKLKQLPIALPPLAEQKRIVAKVEELMALCDRLEQQQQEREERQAALARASLARFAEAPTPANLHWLFHPSYAIAPADLRKSILTLAVQGKLVPQDPEDEPAAVTFRKLTAMAVEADEDTFPVHWLRIPLGKGGEWRGGGTPSKSRPDFWSGDLPWVSPKDMKVLNIWDTQDHISTEAVEGSSVRLIPPGSILMVVRGMILARAFPVALSMREVTINQDMKALLPSEPKIKEFLLVALRAFEQDILAAIEHSSHGTCKLKTEFLHDFIIPVPPLAEQRRIVAKVEELMALVDALEAQLATARDRAGALLAAAVAELTQAN